VIYIEKKLRDMGGFKNQWIIYIKKKLTERGGFRLKRG